MYSCEMFEDQCIVRTHHPPIQAYVHTSLCNFDMTFMVNRTHTDEEKTRSLTYLDERNVTEDNVYLRIPWKKQKLQRMYAPAAISIVMFNTKDCSSDHSRSQTSGIDRQLRNGILLRLSCHRRTA